MPLGQSVGQLRGARRQGDDERQVEQQLEGARHTTALLRVTPGHWTQACAKAVSGDRREGMGAIMTAVARPP